MEETRTQTLDLNRQAMLLLRAGNPEAAMKKLDEAISLDPMIPDSYRNYGDIYMAAEQYARAEKAYEKALLIEKDGRTYFTLGNACFLNDNVHKGLENYHRAISAGYDGDEMLLFMGLAYEHLNDDEMALRYFRKAMAKNPSRPDYQTKATEALIRLGRLKQAEELTDDLLERAPELFDGYHIKTMLLLRQKRTKEAAAFSKEAVDRFPEDVDLMYDYIRCLAEDGAYADAFRTLDIARRMRYFEASRTDFYLLEAQIASQTGDLSRTESCCRTCIASETPEDFQGAARFMLMNILIAKGDCAGALEQAEVIVGRNDGGEGYFAALYYRAACLRELGRKTEAEQAFREAAMVCRMHTLEKPEAVSVDLYRAMCLKELGKYGEAMEILEFLRDLNLEIPEIDLVEAEILEEQGKTAQAQARREAAYAMKPELRPEEKAAASEESRRTEPPADPCETGVRKDDGEAGS